MSTGIGWCDETWNPLLGCDRVSPGCDGCYAIVQAHMHAGHPNEKISTAYAGLTRRTYGGADWTGRVNLLPDRLTIPLHWSKRKPRRIFVNSESDLFHPRVPDSFIYCAFAVMAATPWHTYMFLTKRQARMRSLLRDECRCEHAGHQPGEHFKSEIEWAATSHNPTHVPGLRAGLTRGLSWPLPNVWVGVSVEDQKRADLRIPVLRETPAAVHWLSIEPQLDAIDLTAHLVPHKPAEFGEAWEDGDLGWIVAGGESGPKARPLHPAWARQLRDQAVSADIPFFFKQWGHFLPSQVVDKPEFAGGRAYRDPRGGSYAAAVIREPGPTGTMRTATSRPLKPGDRTKAVVMLDEDTVAVRVGTKAAGNELDGQIWEQFPATQVMEPTR